MMTIFKATNEIERMDLQKRHGCDVSEPVVFSDKVGEINEHNFLVPVTKENGDFFCLSVDVDTKINSYLDFAHAKWHVYSGFFVKHSEKKT